MGVFWRVVIVQPSLNKTLFKNLQRCLKINAVVEYGDG